jgi:hypothetical protein
MQRIMTPIRQRENELPLRPRVEGMKQRAFHVPQTNRTAIPTGVKGRSGNDKTVGWAMSTRAELARLVLQMLRCGNHVATQDALQLRNWAACPEDAMLPLEEIACRILSEKDHPTAVLPLENEGQVKVGR